MENNISFEKLRNIYVEMLKNGLEGEKIIHNIFFNYSTFVNNNEIIYKHKAIISKEFKTEFRNIFLIGSRHLGLKIENEKLILKNDFDSNTDYDYAIVDLKLFAKIFDEYKSDNNLYQKCLLNGFFHPKYNNSLKNDFDKKLSEINEKVSVCVYISEVSFIKKLYKYYSKVIFNEINKYIKMEDIKNEV